MNKTVVSLVAAIVGGIVTFLAGYCLNWLVPSGGYLNALIPASFLVAAVMFVTTYRSKTKTEHENTI